MLTHRQSNLSKRKQTKKIRLSQQPRKQWQLNDFELIKQLGRGRFGEVIAARQKSSDFVVALKRISRKQIDDNKYSQQIKRQIIIQSSLNHQNILKLYGYFWDSKAIYLILQFASQGQLFSLLKQTIKLSQLNVKNIIRQILYGLSYLHSKNIIHRDIKPQNILISGGKVKIADFGWSIYTSRRRETVCGTLDYLSPEMIKGESHNQKVDIWSVGVLAYELSTGRPPFQDINQKETYQKIIQSQIRFPEYLSLEIRSFIRKCLHKDPSRRLSVDLLLQDEFLLTSETKHIQFN